MGARRRPRRRPSGPPSSAAARAAGRVRGTLTPPERERYDALCATAARGGRAVADVPVRALAGGAPVAAIEGLAVMWPSLTPRERAQVSAPLGRGRPGPLNLAGAPVRQADSTTCGSAVLAMVAAAGDPFLALWLVTGRLVDGYVPPELRRVHRVQPDVPAAGAGTTGTGTAGTADAAAARLRFLQGALKGASTRRALGPAPWPAALGTPPWGAARVARWPGVRFTHTLVDDTDPGHLAAVLDRADAALADGVPVPLFSGGDLGRGPAAAVPRHVVLLVPGAPPGPDPAYAVLEPGHGRVHRVRREQLTASAGPHPALGGWSHVCWALLPVAG